jgi:ribosomal protein S27AE
MAPKRRCPRCGQEYAEPPVLSRAGLGDICPDCGLGEALQDWWRFLARTKQSWEQDTPETEGER